MLPTPQLIGIAAGVGVFWLTLAVVATLLVKGGTVERLRKELAGAAPPPPVEKPRLTEELLEAARTLPKRPALGEAAATASTKKGPPLRIVVRRFAPAGMLTSGDSPAYARASDGAARFGADAYPLRRPESRGEGGRRSRVDAAAATWGGRRVVASTPRPRPGEAGESRRRRGRDLGRPASRGVAAAATWGGRRVRRRRGRDLDRPRDDRRAARGGVRATTAHGYRRQAELGETKPVWADSWNSERGACLG